MLSKSCYKLLSDAGIRDTLAGTRSVRGQYYGGNAKEPTTSQGGDKVEATPNSWLEDPFSTHHSGQWVTLRVLTLTLTPLMLVLLSVPSTYFVLRTSLLRATTPNGSPFCTDSVPRRPVTLTGPQCDRVVSPTSSHLHARYHEVDGGRASPGLQHWSHQAKRI